jgi:hypothetical protein
MAAHVRVNTEDPGDDDDVAVPMPKWERKLVIASLIVHVADVFLDVLVLVLFMTEGFLDFALGSGVVVLWAWLASSLYISCGAANSDEALGDVSPARQRCQQGLAFLCNLTQVQVFAEAHRCLFNRGSGDYFHTLRLMEAILEAAPNSLIQLYALAYWPTEHLPISRSRLLRISVAVAFASVGLSFAMFEQKVQARTSGGYVFCCAIMRYFEIASRTSTLALFGTLNYPHGLWIVLVLDYAIVVCLTMRHKSVRSSYSLFLAVPLVLMSYEPVVWRREDHVVPKDRYYTVRGVEFVVMWAFIFQQQAAAQDISNPLRTAVLRDSWWEISVISWASSIGFCLIFPVVHRIARRHELSRDGTSEGDFDPLEQGEGFFSESEGSDDRSHSGSEEQEGQEQDKEHLLPGPRAQKEADDGDIGQE